MKKIRVLVLSIVLILALCVTAGAAVQSWTAVRPTYKVLVNDNEVSGDEVLNVNGSTYLKSRYITEEMGGTTKFENNIAYFNKGIGNEGSNTATSLDYSKLSKSVVRVLKNGNVVGNGFFVGKDKILITKNVLQGSYKILNYKGELISISPNPLKVNNRLALLKTTGYESNYILPVSSEDVEAGNNVALLTSLNSIPNMVNFSTVKDKFDFNWLTTGDLEYLRTYNNGNQTCQGSPLLNSDGNVVGMYAINGANYSIFVTLKDITSFLD